MYYKLECLKWEMGNEKWDLAFSGIQNPQAHFCPAILQSAVIVIRGRDLVLATPVDLETILYIQISKQAHPSLGRRYTHARCALVSPGAMAV